MSGDDQLGAQVPDLLELIRQRTPSRVIVERFGGSYSTRDLLSLRAAHAAARDAVNAECDFAAIVGDDVLVAKSRAPDKHEYLLNPDLGRHFDANASAEIRRRCTPNATLQIVIGDGLSAAAVIAQVPKLLPLLVGGARERGWSLGTMFAVRHCRVGILNEVGELLHPEVVVLLIGERPGLATAESLSAYMVFRPREGHTDADRNLISNIHARGTPPQGASQRILGLAASMLGRQLSGSSLKEEFATSSTDVLGGDTAK